MGWSQDGFGSGFWIHIVLDRFSGSFLGDTLDPRLVVVLLEKNDAKFLLAALESQGSFVVLKFDIVSDPDFY